MLASLSSVLAWAEENGCAAAAFDTPNLELLLAAIGAAEHRDRAIVGTWEINGFCPPC